MWEFPYFGHSLASDLEFLVTRIKDSFAAFAKQPLQRAIRGSSHAKLISIQALQSAFRINPHIFIDM